MLNQLIKLDKRDNSQAAEREIRKFHNTEISIRKFHNMHRRRSVCLYVLRPSFKTSLIPSFF